MFGFFKKNKIEEIGSPCNGQLIALENVPDEVFAQKMMGDGIAVLPNEGKVYSPVDGTIHQIFDTKHAIVIKSNQNTNILIHVGLETVTLEGVPFDLKVSAGDKVQKGDLIMNVDLEYIKSKNLNTIIPVILINDADETEKTIQSKESKLIVKTSDIIMSIK